MKQTRRLSCEELMIRAAAGISLSDSQYSISFLLTLERQNKKLLLHSDSKKKTQNLNLTEFLKENNCFIFVFSFVCPVKSKSQGLSLKKKPVLNLEKN